MKLSAFVVLDNLPASFGARMLGTPADGLSLGRPELLEGGMHEFRDDHLYVVREERLPQRATVHRGAVIVSIGSGRRLRFFYERCCVIQIPDADFYAVFNAVQRIYDRLDAWESTLVEVIDDDASIETMLARSAPVFDNPLTVIDSQFRYLGRFGKGESSDEEVLAGLGASSMLEPQNLTDFLANHDLEMDVERPFLLELLGTSTLNANLIDAGEYLGCLTVYYEGRPWQRSDGQLAEHLSHLLVRAIRRRTTIPGADGTSIRRILMDLVEEVPLDGRERALLDAWPEDRTYACVRLRMGHRLSQLPMGYVCSTMERVLPKSIAFEHHRISVVAFVDLEQLGGTEGPWREEIKRRLEPFVASLQAKAGVSDPMRDLSRARLYFLQASSTLEDGMMVLSDQSVYEFQDLALTGMVIDAMGDMPCDMLFSDGLRRLLEHDRSSRASYLETLGAMLDNSMSVTKTARQLYVHRSTLLERMTRIRRELGEDLDDPDVRLRLQIVLKAMSIQEGVGQNL